MFQPTSMTDTSAAQAAQQFGGQMTRVNNINDVFVKLGGFFNAAIYLLVALAVVFIVWNIVMYVIRGNDPKGKTEAIKSVGWGILGLAIIVSLWGLVGILVRTFRTNADGIPNLPNADFVNTGKSGYKTTTEIKTTTQIQSSSQYAAPAQTNDTKPSTYTTGLEMRGLPEGE